MAVAHSPLGSPEDARAQLRDYVRAMHHAYIGAARLLAPGNRAALPLLAARRVTVVVAAARHLHLMATADRIPAPRGQEVAEPDEVDGLRWTVRFYDPVVLPELGMIAEADAADPVAVRRALGISDVLYHLSVTPGGGLTAHHAQHAGTALVNEHGAAARDGESLRAMLPGRADLVDELITAERLGLHRSLRLLAAALAGEDRAVADVIARGDDDAAVRRAVLAAARSARAANAGRSEHSDRAASR
ncbi:MAG TPA: hypothetical protein VMU94_14355 [Streptosporangiaceae bacterium]|nr:hypothetical protein [Streptosporangiaceae bacterium]